MKTTKSTNKRVQRINEDFGLYILKIILILAFIGCIVWVTQTDGPVGMIPTILAIIFGISLVDLYTDNIQKY